jgi:hypothetical protein
MRKQRTCSLSFTQAFSAVDAAGEDEDGFDDEDGNIDINIALEDFGCAKVVVAELP